MGGGKHCHCRILPVAVLLILAASSNPVPASEESASTTITVKAPCSGYYPGWRQGDKHCDAFSYSSYEDFLNKAYPKHPKSKRHSYYSYCKGISWDYGGGTQYGGGYIKPYLELDHDAEGNCSGTPTTWEEENEWYTDQDDHYRDYSETSIRRVQ